MCYFFDESAPLGSQQQQPLDLLTNVNPENNNNSTDTEALDLPDCLFNLPQPDGCYDLEQDAVLSQLMSDPDFITNIVGENNNAATAAIDLMNRLEPLPINTSDSRGSKRKREEISEESPVSNSSPEPAIKKPRLNNAEIKPLMIDCKTNEKEDSIEEESASRKMKKRLVWTPELHERFVWAVDELGGPNKASPKTIQVKMNVEGLTLQHIKSHLQKFRQQVRRSAKRGDSMKKTVPKIDNSAMLNAGLTSGAVNNKPASAPMACPPPTQPVIKQQEQQFHSPASSPSPSPNMGQQSTLPQFGQDADNEIVRMILDRSVAEMVGRKVNLTADQYNLLYLGFSIGLKTGYGPSEMARAALPSHMQPQRAEYHHQQQQQHPTMQSFGGFDAGF